MIVTAEICVEPANRLGAGNAAARCFLRPAGKTKAPAVDLWLPPTPHTTTPAFVGISEIPQPSTGLLSPSLVVCLCLGRHPLLHSAVRWCRLSMFFLGSLTGLHCPQSESLGLLLGNFVDGVSSTLN